MHVYSSTGLLLKTNSILLDGVDRWLVGGLQGGLRGRLVSGLTSRLVGGLAGGLPRWLVGGLQGWLVGGLPRWLTGRLAGRLVAGLQRWCLGWGGSHTSETELNVVNRCAITWGQSCVYVACIQTVQRSSLGALHKHSNSSTRGQSDRIELTRVAW